MAQTAERELRRRLGRVRRRVRQQLVRLIEELDLLVDLLLEDATCEQPPPRTVSSAKTENQIRELEC